MRVLGIADSDSFIKWGASILDRMPADWSSRLVVIRTPALPSHRQLAAALAGTRFAGTVVPVTDLAAVAETVARQQPDVVVLSVRGPVVRVLVRTIAAAGGTRPVIVSGLPGISIPETMLALYYRSQVDVFLLHSKREIAAFRSLAAVLGIQQDFGLATLPFLAAGHREHSHGDDIVFAAQAKVPRSVEDRTMLVHWLAETARRHPHRRVVVKLRGSAGEAQTHAERYPLDAIMAGLEDAPANLIASTGPMSEHLAQASALVTVSSTAAIEAVAMGIPVLALDDFGVSPSLINVVFEGSGLLGGSGALFEGDFRMPEEQWLDANYFHSPSDETWVETIEAAARRRERGELVLRPQFRGSLGGNLRRVWDRKIALGPYDRSPGGYLALAVGLPLRGAVRRLRSLRRRFARELPAVPRQPDRVRDR